METLPLIVSKQVFQILQFYRPFFSLTCPPKIFVPSPQGHVSKRFPAEKKIKQAGAELSHAQSLA